MAESNNKLFKGLVIVLLLFNTFFLGSIWMIMSNKCGGSACSMMKKDGKVCPLTGKVLKGSAKGSN